MTDLGAAVAVAENPNSQEQQVMMRNPSEDARCLTSLQALHVKVLLQALCYISRDLPLPQSIWDDVSSISQRPSLAAADDATPAVAPASVAESHALPSSDHSQISSADVIQPQARDLSSQRLSFQHCSSEGDFTSEIGLHSPRDHVKDDTLEDLVTLQMDGEEACRTTNLPVTFEEVITNQHVKLSSSASLKQELKARVGKKLSRRLQDLEATPLSLGEQLRMKSLLELQGLKLAALQEKVRSDIISERHLQQACSSVDKHLFDWGLMRLVRTPSSFFGALHGDGFISGLSPVEADERLRRKREAERQRRLEEEEQTRVTVRKRKFFNELLNLVREMQLQQQAVYKRRKQRNDSIQAWHGKQRQRATRAERLRYQALRADDQEAYMRMVEESKNERLTTLLQKTDELLQRLGAMVQMQKDADRADGVKKEKSKDKAKETGKGVSELSSPRQRRQETDEGSEEVSHQKIKNKSMGDVDDQQEDPGESDGEGSVKKRDLLQGQRQYNSLVHSIEEKVTKQPVMLTGGELRPYQLEGLQWMLSLYNNNLNGILADEMGLGKTIQTIALLAYLMENKGLSGPHLIIAPKAVLPNWAYEFATWAPSIIAVLYDGRRMDRKDLRDLYKGDGKFNVLITHYDLIMRDKAFLKKIHWHYMIVDEGHRLKNRDCILSRTLVTGYHIRRRLLLTGTPIQNSLQELWSLLNFLLPAIFNSCANFEEWFNAPFADPSEVSLTEEEQLLIIRRLHQVIRPFLLRRKKAEVEKFLPIKAQVILKCDMSAWQRVYYQQITKSGRVGLDSGAGKSRGLQNTAMQLRKCCNHPYLFLEGGLYNVYQKDEILRASGKFELLDRLLPKLQRTGHRVLLFSQMTRLLDILEIYLNFQAFKYMRLDGTTKTEERGSLLAKFNAPESPYFLFLLSTRAGGLGLNLQTADTVILFDSDWNPQMDQQAEDRAHRIGQKKEVRVFVLASVGTIEEDILDRAKSKMGIDAKVIQAGLFNTTSTAQERRELLEQIMRRGAQSLGTDVPSEREINRLAARSEDEFRLFEKMDEDRRKKEGYKSRLMEEHEIPDWVFLLPKSAKNALADDVDLGGEMSGKRKRKEVMYTDVLSESQWLKALEEGGDVSGAVKTQLSKRVRKDLESAYTMEQGVSGEYYENFSPLEASASYGEGESIVETHSSQKRKAMAQPDSFDSVDELAFSTHIEQRATQKLQVLKLKHPKKPVIAEGLPVITPIHGSQTFHEEHPMNWKGLKRKRSSHNSHAQNDDNGQSSWTGGSKDYSEDY